MIQQLIDAMDLAAATQLPATLRHGLAELRRVTGGTAPHLYGGGSDWQVLATDRGGSYSYWRLTAPVVEVDSDGPSCNDYFQVTYSLRLVTLVERQRCGILEDAARGASSAVRGTDDDIRAALKLTRFGIDRVSVELDSSKVYQQEFGRPGDVPPDYSLVALDISVTAVGKAHCFSPCDAAGSLLCLTVERSTWAAIKACMSATQLQVATDDLCEPVEPCEPLSVRVNGSEYETIEDPCGAIATVTVTQGGVQVGELIDGEWVVPECPPCDPFTIGINGDESVITVEDPCGASTIIQVTQGGEEVGSWDGTAWVIPACDPLTVNLVNTDDDLLESQEVDDCCGQTVQLVAPDGAITFDGLDVGTVVSGGTTNLDCGSLLDAAYVQDGGSVTGSYLVTGTLNGREIYTKDGSHNLEYTGTRWRLVKPGSDVDAALGSETYPWQADWSATSVTVQQATIGAYCGGDEVPCADLTVTVNGTTYGTVADPCGATAAVDVHDSNGNDVGSLVSGAWVVAPPANVLHEYTTGGTWNKPTSASFRGVWVFAAGAGGSGGSGAVSSAGSSARGGSGGGGGSLVRMWIPAASLGLTETYAIGAGGAGPASGNGSAGGATLFGLHAEAKGGSGGVVGAFAIRAVALGGNALLNVPIGSGYSISGGSSGNGILISAETAAQPGMASNAGAGGGGGGGRNTTTSGAGSAGGGCYNNGTLTAGAAAGIAGGGAGTAGTNNIYLEPFLALVTSTIGIGTGGGGGGGNFGTGVTAGAGGVGGRASGGGGGGSTGDTGSTQGAGGAGGNGFLIIYEVYAI